MSTRPTNLEVSVSQQRKIKMSVSGAKSFKELNLYPWIINQCSSIGITTPTPVQANCIGPILEGRSCIGASKTGTGKTLAFALPILQKLCQDPYGIYALILTATRELAYQISDHFSAVGKAMGLRHCVIVGGIDMIKQGLELAKNPHVVIATPGRLADHLESCNTFTLSRVKFVVVDEADRLLGGQFNEQIKTIFDVLPKDRQNLFFSATITDTMNLLKDVVGKDVFVYEAPAEVATVDQLKQQYVMCPVDAKDVYFVQVLRKFREQNSSGNVLVFTDTCKRCQTLSMTLNEVGFENVALHGMIKQKERMGSLSRFRSNIVKILIATDVAARGLDIPSVQLVVNHSIPKIPKEYVHRVGRTARAGRGGRAVTLVTPPDIKLFKAIEKFVNATIEEYTIDDREVDKIFKQVSLTKIEADIKLNTREFYERKLINMRKRWIMEGLDPDEEEKKYFKDKAKSKKANKKSINKKLVEKVKTPEETIIVENSTKQD